MTDMNTRKRTFRVGLVAAVCALTALTGSAGPTDNLRSDYRNPVHRYTNTVSRQAVQLGVGSGYYFTTNRTVNYTLSGYSYSRGPTTYSELKSFANMTPVLRSSVGTPIAGEVANRFLGESIEPPENWDGEEPEIVEGTGGKAVWIDFADNPDGTRGQVVTAEAGPVEIRWGLKGGSTHITQAVVAAAPNKRPVRLYWTHQRPENCNDTLRQLQNAGPTVTFGSNYKVHIYPSSKISVFDPDDYSYMKNDGKGYVYLDGNELKAFEGSYGTFLIVYSRLDEALNERKLLAYEVVEVMEPKQTEIAVKIGDQLKPQSRDFDTNELFPQVSRGLTDDADQGEIYVYQHSTGKQKNYLWAIRDSSANPWKIEVFWRAKEELDVVWPFEVDIYAACWDKTGAQMYVRDTEEDGGGKAKTEPVVYYPSGVTIAAMDYQVCATGEKKHAHVNDGVFYTDWADDDTYALLKYTSGDSVWFQTVRSIPAKNEELLAELSLDFEGARTNKAYRTGTFKDDPEVLEVYKTVALADEVRAPFAADDGFFYPGWINREHIASPAAVTKVKNPYNPELYQYPSGFVATNELYAPIFPVNLGELEVWWSLPSQLMGTPRTTGGNTESLNAQIYFPSIPVTYDIITPEAYDYDYGDYRTTRPQIVLASGKGSAGFGLNDHLDGHEWDWEWDHSRKMHFSSVDGVNTGLVTRLVGMGNPIGITSNFTFEARLERRRDSDEINHLVSFYRSVEGSVESTPYLRLAYDDIGNFYLNGNKLTDFAEFPREFCEFTRERPSEDQMLQLLPQGIHVAFVHTADGVWKYYLNGCFVGSWSGYPASVDVSGDTANIFERRNGEVYYGPIHYLRFWSEARSAKEIDLFRYQISEAASKLVFQYDGTTQRYDGEGEEGVDSGALAEGFVVDSSGHGASGYFGYAPERFSHEIMSSGCGWTSMHVPHPGQTFSTDATVYRQTDPELPGYNPNEEHAFISGGVAYALRCDQNKMDASGKVGSDFTSLPYVLVSYTDADTHRAKMCALRVIPENDVYRFRSYYDAGQMIQSPAPLSRMQPANLQTFMSGPLYADTEMCFRDRKGWFWAHQAGDDGGATNYVFELSYPSQASFDYTTGASSAPGEPVPWLANYERRDDWYVWIGAWDTEDRGEFVYSARDAKDPVGTAIDWTYVVNWPENVPGLYVNDTLHEGKASGSAYLPSVRGQLSAKILYQQSTALGGKPSARLIDPESIQYGGLKVIPDEIRTYADVKTSRRHFTDFPPILRSRFVWNPNAYYDPTHNDTRELELSGKYIADGNYAFSLLNVMDSRTLSVVTDPDIVPGSDVAEWQTAMNQMPVEAIELTDDVTPFTEIALATTGKGSGYVTLVFNDSTNLSMVAKSENVTMHVIKVVPELYNGYLHTFQSDNPLDKQVCQKYTSDFGGRPDLWEFEWQYAEPVNGRAPTDEGAWFSLAGTCGKPGVPMLDWITIGDAGVFGLSDHCVRCRYRALDPEIQAVVGTGWSNYCTPKYTEGWVKRVLKAINPFDQRIRDFLENPVNTQLSVLQQAGAPYNGDVPLNMDAIDKCGLLEIYETVLNEAKKLSIDGNELATGSLALSLQMAAGRICELYTALGNEAYADALNPTVDLGSMSGVDDSADSSIFPFMNQCENLLDEELSLLRGRDLSMDYADSWITRNEPYEYPFYNRLAWNFTADIAGGQVAYVENYGIRDVCGASDADDPEEKDGIIDVYDAKNLYPQGHGDAWGHYLSAVKGYYALLKHPNFGWKPQLEGVLAGQTAITISYLHEKRFAEAAEMKAKAGEKIVADTYRQLYEAGNEDPWELAEDDAFWVGDDGEIYDRAWGVDDWATRAHLGAYYDWAMVNALLPAREAEEGMIKMLDRESTKELDAIAQSAMRIQSTADYADIGLNPLGLSDSAIPFDISPSEIDAGKTHFEQILERAKKAVRTAKQVFDRAKGVSNRLRDQNASSDYQRMVDDQEAAINRDLIRIYGYPYADDIGAGKTYPQGYEGPDLYHYYYIETYDLDGSGGINGSYRGVSTGDGSYGRYIDVKVDDYSLITTNIVGTYQAEIDESLADNGFLGNIIVGSISWYQDKLAKVGSYIDPFTKYTGICSTNYTLPVAVVATTGDALDGKVDYTFAVAAWTNSPWYASYFVGEDGFTPKPKDFRGQRKAEGECQIALNGYAALLAEIDVAANKLLSANEKLQGLIDELTSLDYTTQMGYVTDAAKTEVENYTAACKKNAETVKTTLEALKEFQEKITESGVEAFPKLTGLSFDLTSIGRAALLAVESGLKDVLNGQIADQISKIGKAEKAIDELEDKLSQQFAAWMDNADRQKKIAEIKEQAANVKIALAELEVTYNNANEKRMQYAKIVAEGKELQAERERQRIQWAADLSQSRYRNMMFQILRNDELARYNQAFELAAKYVFLAAKAYDYETGMLKSDSSNAAGSEFMSQIVKARALGRFAADGQPLVGGSEGDPGLADILCRMETNWDVLKGRLGFNNAQSDLDHFSLRKDLMGKTLDESGDQAWRNVLASCWVENLKTHPAFAQYCQPFDPMEAKEPGFVIPFRTVIAARQDLFGNDLAGGSTAYSSTYFATKLRGVGVWIEGAQAAASLPTRPEVYLVPTGLDYMRVPIRSSTSSSAAKRTWQVVDQVLPIPYALTDTDWESPDWSMLKDVFSNELCVQRRHPAIRARVGSDFDESLTMNYNARLIGRSVWNDQWYVIIPAASLNANGAAAKDAFLDSVKDIHLYLKTYSFSGN